ncbi:MAG: hypothetical protein E6772_04180 [Dysgonomonas sp.]|nr:hypothetical protein [Dysgonomonas sp.]
MIKRPIQIILFFTLCILFTSCSVYEDVYFNEDGTVSYSLKYDASQILAMAPDALSRNSNSSTMPSDSTFSIADVMEEHKDSLHLLPAEKREILEAIKPFSIALKSDSISKEFNISLNGDFESADAMNAAFIALQRIYKEQGSKKGIMDAKAKFDINYSSSHYSWDGKKMSRTIIIEEETAETPNENVKGYQEMVMLFSGGKMITRYHFPQRVTSVDKEKALFSQDGKTIVIEQAATTHLKPTAEEFDITIETE